MIFKVQYIVGDEDCKNEEFFSVGEGEEFEIIEELKEDLDELVGAVMDSYRIIAELETPNGEWDPEDCEEFCRMAGLEKEWNNSDGETFEKVLESAAEKLGVIA